MITYTNTWQAWATEGTTSATSTFENWCDGTNTATMTGTWAEWSTEFVQYGAPSRTPEEVRLLEARNAESKKSRGEAIKRARTLLVDSLTPEQAEQYDANMEFIVYGQKTKNRYLIKDGRVGNVHQLDKDGRTRRKYCAHPAMYIPNADTMLAQKLMLECNEQDFLDLANVS